MEGKTEKLLKNLGRKIDAMLGDIDGSSGKLKEELNKRYEELKKSAHSLENDMKDFKNKHQDKWDEVESGIEKAGQDVRDAFNKTFRKAPKENQKDEGPSAEGGEESPEDNEKKKDKDE